jgi:histidinol-phosphate aminotransferase
MLERTGFDVADPAVANFVYADTRSDARAVFDALLHEGVIVRPLNAFGAETAIRVTVGTSEENAFLEQALERVVAASIK